MEKEEQTQKCSNSSGTSFNIGGIGCFSSTSSGRSLSKKTKQKKAPQRGLGVAQLEKIRLEEQQKNNSAISTKSASSYNIPLPFPEFHHLKSSPSPISFPNSLSRADLSSSDNISRPNPPYWNIDVLPNVEKETSEDDSGLVVRSNLFLPYESNLNWHPPTRLMQRTQHYQQPFSAQVKNVPVANSSSNLLNFHMEPPSNQSYYSNYSPMWLEEEKTVGMKRPYPFSLEDTPIVPFTYKLPNSVPMRLDESASSGHIIGTLHNLNFNEGTSCSTSILEPTLKKSTKEDALNGDFLTLAPPTINRMRPSSKFKHSSASLTLPNRDFPYFPSLPFQGDMEIPLFQIEPRRPYQPQSFSGLFPAARAHISEEPTPNMNKSNGEVGESVDLNLKL